MFDCCLIRYGTVAVVSIHDLTLLRSGLAVACIRNNRSFRLLFDRLFECDGGVTLFVTFVVTFVV